MKHSIHLKLLHTFAYFAFLATLWVPEQRILCLQLAHIKIAYERVDIEHIKIAYERADMAHYTQVKAVARTIFRGDFWNKDQTLAVQFMHQNTSLNNFFLKGTLNGATSLASIRSSLILRRKVLKKLQIFKGSVSIWFLTSQHKKNSKKGKKIGDVGGLKKICSKNSGNARKREKKFKETTAPHSGVGFKGRCWSTKKF